MLPLALEDVKTGWSLDDGLETSLAALIQQDKGDYGSRNKLRLIMICRQLCDIGVAARLAIVLVASQPITDLQYTLMGDGEERCSLLELLRPRTPPLQRFLGVPAHASPKGSSARPRFLSAPARVPLKGS